MNEDKSQTNTLKKKKLKTKNMPEKRRYLILNVIKNQVEENENKTAEYNKEFR